MTIQVQYWVHTTDQAPVEHVTRLSTPSDVERFAWTLSGDTVSDAIVTHEQRPRIETAIPDDDAPGSFLTIPDHSMIVGVHGDRAALSYRGCDGYSTEAVHLYSLGDGPDHPVLYETDEFPPRCEVPVQAMIQALTEFLHTAKRPTLIAWQPAQAQTRIDTQ
ncbi:Imm1 family immunity protein [Amycolatopsis sp. NPDC059021]|uniref:Imm1 family immunity protein n=1 Tax=Amycolatopsis sp. NPDC059021 TaxID=3346704 RepID=UPI00366B456B